MERQCGVCGKNLSIILKEDGSYSGGYYFGKIKLPTGKGEYINMGKKKILDSEFEVVKWTGEHKEIEYWECDKCYNN